MKEALLQRIISKSSGESDESMLLSESEKEELMLTLQETVDDLQNEKTRLDNIKDKVKIINDPKNIILNV